MYSVSVIIPSCERPNLLAQAVKSVQNQTRKPNEIVVVNDASTESYDEVIKGLKKEAESKDISFTYVYNQKQEGGAESRNIGVRNSSGNILMFLDDDDTWTEHKIADQLDVFKNNEEVGLVYSGRIVVDGSDRDQELFKVNPKDKGFVYPEILYHNIIGITSSVALKKDIFEEAGGFDPLQMARNDYDLWIRCCKITQISHDDSYNVVYTLDSQTGNQISRGKIDRHYKANQRIFEKYSDDISREGFIGARKIKAELYFYLMKTARKESLTLSLPWLAKALFQYPKPKYLISLLPEKWTAQIRKTIKN